MATAVTDNTEAGRHEIHVDGELAGFAEYYRHGGVIAYLHTEIKPDFGDRGLATQLIRGALDDARASELQVEPFCQFVRAFVKKNPEYRDLVAAGQWERFELV